MGEGSPALGLTGEEGSLVREQMRKKMELSGWVDKGATSTARVPCAGQY